MASPDGDESHDELLGLAGALRRLADGRPELTARVDRLIERTAAGRFHVTVLGDFKRGKSTLVNAIVKPLVKLVSILFYILTLGLFFLVVNALMLLLTSWITGFTDYGLEVDGFWTAVLAGLIITVISVILTVILPDGKKKDRDRR